MNMTRREMIKLSSAAFAAAALNIPFSNQARAEENSGRQVGHLRAMWWRD